VTSMVVCESCSFSMKQMSDFHLWVSSPFCLACVLDPSAVSLFGRVLFALVLVFLFL
jgi:hypothetical protein